jgi:hypothetical protein
MFASCESSGDGRVRCSEAGQPDYREANVHATHCSIWNTGGSSMYAPLVALYYYSTQENCDVYLLARVSFSYQFPVPSGAEKEVMT